MVEDFSINGYVSTNSPS